MHSIIGADPVFSEKYELDDVTFYNYHAIGVYKYIIIEEKPNEPTLHG